MDSSLNGNNDAINLFPKSIFTWFYLTLFSSTVALLILLTKPLLWGHTVSSSVTSPCVLLPITKSFTDSFNWLRGLLSLSFFWMWKSNLYQQLSYEILRNKRIKNKLDDNANDRLKTVFEFCIEQLFRVKIESSYVFSRSTSICDPSDDLNFRPIVSIPKMTLYQWQKFYPQFN